MKSDSKSNTNYSMKDEDWLLQATVKIRGKPASCKKSTQVQFAA